MKPTDAMIRAACEAWEKTMGGMIKNQKHPMENALEAALATMWQPPREPTVRMMAVGAAVVRRDGLITEVWQAMYDASEPPHDE